MNSKQWKQSRWGRLGMFTLIYLLLALVMYWVVAEDWSMTSVRTDAVTMSQLQPENAVVEQTFTAEMDVLQQVSITPHFNNVERSGSALLSGLIAIGLLLRVDKENKILMRGGQV